MEVEGSTKIILGFKAVLYNQGSRWLSYSKTDRQLQESFAQKRILAWGFIFFVTLIGALNIINTIYTNIYTRINEIGMQRAIGMDNKSLYKVFLWEEAYYGINAAISGSIAGYIISIFMSSTATGQLEFSNLPIIPILAGSVLSKAVCLIANYDTSWQDQENEYCGEH